MSNSIFSKQLLKIFITTVIGSIIFAIGIDAFLIPHKLLAGGMSGIAIMVYFLTGWAPGTVNMVLNIPILFAAWRWLGGLSVVATIMGTVFTSFALDYFTFLSTYNLTQNPLVGAMIGGVLVGLGCGVIYRAGGNTGGIDPIAQIIRKYKGLQLGNIIFAINLAIVAALAILFNIEIAAITIFSIYISATIVNKIIVGFDQQKAIFVISEHSEELSEQVIHTIGRGATLLQARGAYTKKSKEVLLIVANLMQVTKVKTLIHDYDPNAFMLITDASEVIGLGFTTKLPNTVKEAIDNAEARQKAEEQRLLEQASK